MSRVRARLLISGRVQGVCFRMYAEEEAKRLRVAGWVRNLPTGQVEALIEGPREAVELMLTWCRKGPPAARVTKIDVTWENFHGDYADFRIVH